MDIERVVQMRADGTFYFNQYAWPGGYTILYYDNQGFYLCAKCAGEVYNKQIYGDNETPYTVTGCDVYYEGPATECAECYTALESSYGETDEGMSKMDKVHRDYSHMMCMQANDGAKRVYITKEQAQSLLNKQGAYREKHKRIHYMEVDILDSGERNNVISCYAEDGTHLADIAYRGLREGWFICG